MVGHLPPPLRNLLVYVAVQVIEVGDLAALEYHGAAARLVALHAVKRLRRLLRLAAKVAQRVLTAVRLPEGLEARLLEAVRNVGRCSHLLVSGNLPRGVLRVRGVVTDDALNLDVGLGLPRQPALVVEGRAAVTTPLLCALALRREYGVGNVPRNARRLVLLFSISFHGYGRR